MWMDARGVTHTVALPDPSVALSGETVASLIGLAPAERARLLDLLDDYYWNDYINGWRVDLAGSPLAAEGEPLPSGYVQGTIDSADAAMARIRSTEPAWRIDVLEVLQDFLEALE
jgi:hypothetical protein